MESSKQEKKNLLNDNPIASHGAWISKHSIAAGSPLHAGGSKKDKKKGVQPNRADVEVDKTTRLTREGTIVKSRNSGGVVIGGGYDSQGRYVPRTAEQKSKDRR